MSMSPNNPFEDHQNDQGERQSPPPRKSGKGCLIGCLIAGFLGLLVCCGGSALLIPIGLSVLGSEYQRQLAGNPVIIEHIGEIESFEASLSTTISEAQKSGDQGSNAPIAFEVKGTKGSGTLLIQQDRGGDGTGMKSATLVMPDGTRHPIDVSAGPPGVEELEIDLSDLIDTGDLDTGDPDMTGPADTPEPADAQEN